MQNINRKRQTSHQSMKNLNKRWPIGDNLPVKLCVSLCFFVAVLLTSPGTLNAQGKITGFVVDDEFEEPLEKAVITIPGTLISVLTDQQGKYELKMMPGDYFMEVNYPGYFPRKYNISVSEGITTPMFIVKLQADKVGEAELRRLTGRENKLESARASEIYTVWQTDEQRGHQEFNEIFRSVPSASVWGNGSGYGESGVGFRGMSPENTSYTSNGILLNNPETGKMSSAVLSGLTNRAGFIQVLSGQTGDFRGETRPGGLISVGSYLPHENQAVELEGIYGNEGFLKTSATVHSGLTKKGFASSVQLLRTAGNGLVQNTDFEQYDVFTNIFKRFSHRHTLMLDLNFTLQKRNRNFQDSVGAYTVHGPKYNRTWGFLDGKPVSWSTNFERSPMVSLTHFWQPRIKTFVTTRLFAQFNGDAQLLAGESFPVFKSKTFANTSEGRSIPGSFAALNDSLVIERLPVHAAISRESRYGLNIKVMRRVNKKLDITGGLSLEHYHASRFGAIHDLPAGEKFISEADVNRPEGFVVERQFIPSFFPDYGTPDKTGFYYGSTIQTAGLSIRADYRKGKKYGFLEGSASLQNLHRTDHFNYLSTDDARKSGSTFLPGAKGLGGIRLGLWDYHSLLFRTGFGTYQPLFVQVYPMQTNWKNQDVKNQQVFEAELGYSIFSRRLKLEVTGYRTTIAGGTMIRPVTGTEKTGLVNGLSELHRGVEVRTSYKLTRNFQLMLNGSVNEWKYTHDAVAKVYDQQGGDPVSAPELWLQGVKTGNAPQLSLFAEAEYRWAHNFYFRLNYYRAEKIYAPFGIYDFASLTSRDDFRQWQLPYYHLVGVSGNYLLTVRKFGTINLIFGGNNLLDTEYIEQTATNIPEGSPSYNSNLVFYGPGRTWFAGLKIQF